MKFKKEMLEAYDRFSRNGWAVFLPEMNFLNSQEHLDIQSLHNLHDFKIKHSDAIFVVNKDGYIGKDTAREIRVAQELGKEIRSLEPLSLEKLPL